MMSQLSKSLGRVRRIIGRQVNRKELPAFLYRFDQRLPVIVRAQGFQPWNGSGLVSLLEHVNNSYQSGANQGKPTKHDSQWVSAGAYGFLKKIDPTFAQQLLNTNLYKIDTHTAVQSGDFYDVNDHFDRQGVDRPYSTQREWAKLGGIDQTAIIEYMTGINFAQQLNSSGEAPDEDQLVGWTTF